MKENKWKRKRIFYSNGKWKYEGEYLNGQRLNGKLYNPDGNLNCDLIMKIGLI